MKNLFKVIGLIASILILLACGEKENRISGQWKGAINVSGTSLNLVFDFKEAKNKLTAQLYSINQGNTAIDIDDIEFKKDMIMIRIPSIGAVYQGKLVDDVMIGTFTQNGGSFVLDLRKMKEGEFKIVEDEYEGENDLYTSSNVTFENKKDAISLAGTISIPKEGGKFPAVVLLTGSGAQNRDEEIVGHRPFKRIADYFSSRGVVVLRYDDRGCFKSEGYFNTATSLDFLSDALAAIDYLKHYQNIDTSRIGVIGHSEGGQIAIMLAAQHSDVSFIVSLGGPMLAGEELILLQSEKINRASGMDNEEIQNINILNAACYDILKKEPDDAKAKLAMVAAIKHYAINDDMKTDAAAEVIANSAINPWFRYFLTNNASDYIAQVNCPALIMFGEKDLQVPAYENEIAFHKAVNNNKYDNITLTIIEGVNHLFQKAETGLPTEYSNLDNAAMNDTTLNIIYTWMKEAVL